MRDKRYTDAELKQINDLTNKHYKILDEMRENIARLRDPDDLPKKVSRPTPPRKPRSESAKAVANYERRLAEYEEGHKAWGKETEDLFRQWYDEGSEEWKKAEDDYYQAVFKFRKEEENLLHDLEEKHYKAFFTEIGYDPELIIEDACVEAEDILSTIYEQCKNVIETKHDKTGERLTGFSYPDLRVEDNGREIWLDTANMIDSILGSLEFHFDALKDNPQAFDRLESTIVRIVSNSPLTSTERGILGAWIKFRPPQKPRSKKQVPVFQETALQDQFTFPTTPLCDLLYNIFSNNGDLTSTANMINAVSKQKRATVLQKTKDGRAGIHVKTNNSDVIVELLNSSWRTTNGRASIKILLFAFKKMYERVYHNSGLKGSSVEFSLREMVDKKLYSSTQNARKAFLAASDDLTSIRISAVTKTGKKRSATGDITGDPGGRFIFFPSMYIENGQCNIGLNPNMNWVPILKDFFIMPDSWWSLPNNAQDLEYKIFRQARLNKNKIQKDKSLTFTVSLRSIAEWLRLPLKTKNPKRNVKEVIETAVDQIRNSLDQDAFDIDIKTELGAPLPEYLSGHLEVTMRGKYTNNLLELHDKQQKRIVRNIRRKEKIVAEASIRKLTQTMIDEEKEESEIKVATEE